MPLAPQVEQAAADALLELVPAWLAQPARDYRRVLRPTGPGNHSITIEPYRGSMTWVGFLRHLESSATVPRLKAAIDAFQPELARHLILPDQTIHLGDSNALVTTWCMAVESELGPTGDIALAVRTMLVRLSNLLDARTLTHRITTAIAGLQLPSPEFQINLEDRVILHTMATDEHVELANQFNHTWTRSGRHVASRVQLPGIRTRVALQFGAGAAAEPSCIRRGTKGKRLHDRCSPCAAHSEVRAGWHLQDIQRADTSTPSKSGARL